MLNLSEKDQVDDIQELTRRRPDLFCHPQSKGQFMVAASTTPHCGPPIPPQQHRLVIYVMYKDDAESTEEEEERRRRLEEKEDTEAWFADCDARIEKMQSMVKRVRKVAMKPWNPLLTRLLPPTTLGRSRVGRLGRLGGGDGPRRGRGRGGG